MVGQVDFLLGIITAHYRLQQLQQAKGQSFHHMYHHYLDVYFFILLFKVLFTLALIIVVVLSITHPLDMD